MALTRGDGSGGSQMTKRWAGTTLIYDVGADEYFRTEIYMSDDPAETIELDICGTDLDEPTARPAAETHEEPLLLREDQIKRPPGAQTIEGLPFLRDE